jgi:hypothetical protein
VPGLARHVDRDAELLLHRDAADPDRSRHSSALRDDAARVRLEVVEDLVDVLVHLDEDAAFALADLHGW